MRYPTKPVILSATILGAFAVAAIASFFVSPHSIVSISSLASSSAGPIHEPPASPRTRVAAVPETGRPPVPIVRPPSEQAQIPPAPSPPPAPVAELPSIPAPPATLSRGAAPSVDDSPLAEQRLHSALAPLPRGPDIRYWIVPLADGRVMVVAGRKDDPGPVGRGDKPAKHRRRGWN